MKIERVRFNPLRAVTPFLKRAFKELRCVSWDDDTMTIIFVKV